MELLATAPRRLVFLGSGTSTGVPVFGCDCAVCTSEDPRNQRLRPSVLLAFPLGNLLIDTTPEMRLQLLRAKVRKVDAIAYTHNHADHLFGLDDARLFPKYLGGRCRSTARTETEASIRLGLPLRVCREGNDVATGACPQAPVRAGRARGAVSGARARGDAAPPGARPVPGSRVSDRQPGILAPT